jgi:hypothetical protein
VQDLLIIRFIEILHHLVLLGVQVVVHVDVMLGHDDLDDDVIMLLMVVKFIEIMHVVVNNKNYSIVNK